MEVLLTTKQSYRQVAQVLGKAFADDPVSVAVYKNFPPEKRVKALTTDFSIELPVCIRKGYPIHASEGGRIVGAAVIYPPGTYPLPILDQWLIQLASILGNGWYDIRSWLTWLNEVDKYRPREDHYYLEYLGIEPGFQGRGFGTCLLNHLIAKADEQGLGCYLENANPRNVLFYQRAGFQIQREMDIIGIPSWFMWRPPIKE